MYHVAEQQCGFKVVRYLTMSFNKTFGRETLTFKGGMYGVLDRLRSLRKQKAPNAWGSLPLLSSLDAKTQAVDRGHFPALPLNLCHHVQQMWCVCFELGEKSERI